MSNKQNDIYNESEKEAEDEQLEKIKKSLQKVFWMGMVIGFATGIIMAILIIKLS